MSIVIPCHNEENNLDSLLWSLKNQVFYTDYKVELIFSLDNCTDNSKQVIENFDFDNKYTVKITECCVRYCGIARNEGMKLATGKYIWFVDADDYIVDPFAISILLECFKTYPEYSIIHFHFASPADCVYKNFAMMMWQYCIKKDIVDNIPFKKIKPSEDAVFWQHVQKKYPNIKILELPKTLYFYQSHGPNNFNQIIYEDKIYYIDDIHKMEIEGNVPWYI